jgi:hypothetical protein
MYMDSALEALTEQVDRLTAMLAALSDVSSRAGHPLALRPGQEWATAAQLAHRYGFEDPQTIRRRAAEFGGAPIDDGLGSDLRFHVSTADAHWRAQQQKLADRCRPPIATRAPRRPRQRRAQSPLGHPLVEF